MKNKKCTCTYDKLLKHGWNKKDLTGHHILCPKRKFNPNVKIHCPKHGLQPSNPNTEHAIACIECFPIKK